MAHGIKGRKFSRKTTQRLALLRSLATALITHKRIETTVEKAKDIRPYVEKLITKSKKATLSNIKALYSTLYTKEAVRESLKLGQTFANRNGGYTRILKTGFRQGDSAALALIEFVE